MIMNYCPQIFNKPDIEIILMTKRICFFSTSFAIHKQARTGYAEKFLPEDAEIFLLTPKKHNKYSLKRTKVIEMPGDKILFVLKMREFCIKNKIDVLINLGSPNEAFAMFLSTFFSNTRYIIHFCSNIFDLPYGEKSLLKNLFLSAYRLFLSVPVFFVKKSIFTSEDIEEKARKQFFLADKSIKFIPLILDENIFAPENKSNARKKLNLPLNKKIILYVGRISYLKGSDILFELAKENPEKLFIFIGEIFDHTILKNNPENIILLKSREMKDLIKYYNAADLFIFPSRIEAYGLVHREAMLCETPALVSDITALRLTKHTLKAKPNTEDMQKQIERFFAMSKKERQELGKLGRQYVIETNSYENLKDKWREALMN